MLYWIMFVVVMDLLVIAIRTTVYMAFGERPLIKKYFVEPIDKCWFYIDEARDKAAADVLHGKSGAKGSKLLLEAWLIAVPFVMYTVPYASIVLGLIVDPILNIMIAKGVIRLD